MLDFALKVTTQPASLTRGDLDGLRAAGFADADILSIVLVTCLCNFMNRVATSLGVEAPPSFQRSAKSWLTGPAIRQAWLLGTWADPAPDTNGLERVGTLLELNSHQGSIPLSELSTREAAIAPQELNPDEISNLPPATKAPIQHFLDQCCVIGSEQSCTAREIYIAYVKWCDENQHRPELQRNFGMGLSDLEFHRHRRSQGRHWWDGIGLKSRDENKGGPPAEEE